MPFPYPFPIEFGVWPSIAVVINDEIQDIKKGSSLIDLIIEERGVAEFTIVDILASETYQKGQPVTIYDTTDTLVFGGVIDTPEKTSQSPAGGLYHLIRCADWHYLADKRLVAESYLNQTCGFIVDDIFDKYLVFEGVTIGNIELGATLIEAVFNYVRISDAYDALAEKAGKIWFIDENKALYFVARDTYPAPWNATTAEMIKGSPRLSGGNPKYRNRQYIRGGKDVTLEQTEDFIGDGKQDAFTLSFPIAKVPSGATGSVKIDGGAAKTMGIKGLDAPGDFEAYWNKGDPTIYFTVTPGALAAIEVKYYGQFDILTLVEDADEIASQLAIEGAGTGYVDDIADEPKLTDKDASFDSGLAKLARFGVPGLRFHYQTLDTGLKPGQLQTIDYPLLGLNSSEMLIEAVRIRGMGKEVIHDITAIQGPEMGSWTDLFKSLAAMKGEIIERLNVGAEQILIILADSDGNVEVSETITDVVYACSLVETAEVGTAIVC